MLKFNYHFRTGILALPMILVSFIVCSQDKLPTLKEKDYDQWQSLQQTWISDDGTWTAWHIGLVEGDDTLYIKHTSEDKSYRFELAGNLQFSKDSRWAAFRIGYPEKELEAKREKNEAVKYKMKLLNLESGEEELFEDINRFSFSEASNHLLMVTYPPKGIKHKGKDIILRNLVSGQTRNIGNVSEWAFNKKGNYLAYIIDAEGKKGNGVELFRLANYQVVGIDSDTSSYLNLSWERKNDAFTFLKAVYDTNFKEPTHEVFAVKEPGQASPRILSFKPSPGKNMPDSMRIRETYRPVWSEDLSALFIGIHEWTPLEKEKDKSDEKKDNAAEKSDSTKKSIEKKPDNDEKLPGLDIWHWKDDAIQPRQKITYNADRNFTYLCAWNLGDDKLVRLTDDDYRGAMLCGDQKNALVLNRKPYQPQFLLEYADYKIIDTKTGLATGVSIKFNTRYMNGSSPDGNYLLYFKDHNWWSYDIRQDKHINLTESIDSEFWNTRDDQPIVKKPPFGRGGWYKADQQVLLYDEYDVWAVKPDGSEAQRLTTGRENEIIYRALRLDREEDWLDPEQDLYLSMFGDKTKKSGFARLSPRGKFEELIYLDKSIRGLSKSKSSPSFIFTSRSYEDSPDLFFVSESFKNPEQLSETNPQQKEYAWGKTELVSFTNEDGKILQGVLHYPANYEAGKKYPMIVNIYEIRSNGIHNYVVPSPRSAYNYTNYIQQGYFIFQPDIVYKTNHPGESAVECVVPAVGSILETGMIDVSKIGLMGHSWGGYQTAFLITQTDLFSAAVAGAPLTNMISMYNSIYWNSGTPDQRIFETAQGRFDEPYWEIMDNYEENSPLFQSENITAPLLVAFGDEDGAVDWHQGIEMYITMRRMEKSMIMLVYAGENHGLAKKENQLDYTRKVNEFFNHHLLGVDAPDWIDRGVPYLDKKKKEEEKKK